MKDATDILIGGFAIWFALLVGNAFLNRAPQPVAPEAIVMEAEDRPFAEPFAPTPADIAYVEAVEPSKLPPQQPQKEASSLPVREPASSHAAPAPPLKPVHPQRPPMAQPKVDPVPGDAPTSAPVYKWHNTMQEAQRDAALRNVPVLVHFVAPGCQNCKLVRGMIDRTPAVRRVLSGYALVSIDGEAHPDIADMFAISEWNTIALYLPWKQGTNAKKFIPHSEPVHFISDLKFTLQELEKS